MRERREEGRQRREVIRKGEERLQLREEGHNSQQSDADTVHSRTYILFADFHNPLSNLCQCMLGCEISINKKICEMYTYLYNVL